jgi:ABC-2 type transport system permease protein
MRKMWAVLKREYLQAVRKKMFIIMTFLMPVLMAALFILPSRLMMRGLGVKKVVVLDGTGTLRETFSHADAAAAKRQSSFSRDSQLLSQISITYVDRRGDMALPLTAKPYLEKMTQGDKKGQIDGVLLIPGEALVNPTTTVTFYSRSATDFMTQERLTSMTNRGLQRLRLAERGLSSDDVARIMTSVNVDAVQLSKTGQQKKGGAASFLVGFMLTALLLIPSFVYGLEIMRGIIQEKTDRVVEVLVSSMSPSELLIGKILGVALVGLTQIGVWLIMAALAGTFAAATATFAGIDVLQFLHASFFVYFIVFFVLAYLTYVCAYAIGGAACNSEKEAQQLIMPITMFMMLPWFLMAAIITNPDSTLTVAFSLSPVFGPLTMFVRTLVGDPPMSHVLASIAVSLVTVSALLWVTAKIFRVGILSYGKRPTVPELWRWIKVA